MEFLISNGVSSVPAGVYRATYISVEETDPHPEYGRGVRFRFKVTSGEYDGQEASVICGIEKPPTPKNRLGKILGGLAGNPVQPGQSINAELFIGKSYMIQVGPAPSGTGTRIETVIPNFT